MESIDNVVQTDVCGIKWSVLRSSASLSPSPGDPLDDPILSAFSRALEVTNNSKATKFTTNNSTMRKTLFQEGNSFILTNHHILNFCTQQKTNESREEGNDKVAHTQAGFLAVWRRVPRRHLVTYSFDPAGNEVAFHS